MKLKITNDESGKFFSLLGQEGLGVVDYYIHFEYIKQKSLFKKVYG